MNENFTSLVFFTVLCQTATGALIFRGLTLLWKSNETITYESARLTLAAISVLLIISLVLAFFHLGKPVHAINAINNLSKSWLSREILSLSILIALVLSFLLINNRSNIVKIEPVFFIVSSITGIIIVYSMIRIYMIPVIISWYNPFTPVSFICSTLLCGLAYFLIFNYRQSTSMNSIAIILIAIFILSSFINSTLFKGSFIGSNIWLYVIRTILLLVALSIVTAFFFSVRLNKMFSLWVILFIMIICSELINRFIFFLSFEKSVL
jgi:anaerobic dimethyl sulfoxide reductase subunit C